MIFKFVEKNPANINDGYWIAKLEVSKSETLVFGIDNSGDPKIYLYIHVIRSQLHDSPVYRLHSCKGLPINSASLEIGETTRTLCGNRLPGIRSKYNIFETGKGIHIAGRKNDNIWETRHLINHLETRLLKARIKSLSKKIKKKVEKEFLYECERRKL
jgi:hypothetical protein